ncbi:GNAT family N-acetyltransferase [Streptomyces sp. NPDC051018]|uniref:GNAT family N-acetyltransferase n=1 Tax=Streptomyces sp. NPDC051018 TaxID=3365639 RepID=UPI00379BB216
MTLVRRAAPKDAEELVRLRKIMLDACSGPNPDVSWQPLAVAALRERLGDPGGNLTAFVVERPGGLAACAIGSIERPLPGPGNPRGVVGHVFSVATDPDMRRQGYSRACMQALVGWFREREVPKVDLRASPEGEPLYEALGFVRTREPAMRLAL